VTQQNYFRSARERLSMTQQQFATAVGVSRGAVHQWELCGGTAPRRASWSRVAAVLGVSVDQMLAGLHAGSEPEGLDAVPLLQDAPDPDRRAGDTFPSTRPRRTVHAHVDVTRHTFAMHVHGDCMTSATGDSFPPGSLLIVEPEMAPVSGDYVIALVMPSVTTFKQYVVDGGDRYLKPLNHRYATRLLGDARIVGVVREMTKRFR
jgi:transcriptional regulator with XRE-family HTH domain